MVAVNKEMVDKPFEAWENGIVLCCQEKELACHANVMYLSFHLEYRFLEDLFSV